MHKFVLYQHMFIESGSKQFIDSLDVFLTPYIEIIAMCFFILLLLAILLAIIEKREERAGRNYLARRQNHQASDSQNLRHSACDALFISRDSLV